MAVIDHHVTHPDSFEGIPADQPRLVFAGKLLGATTPCSTERLHENTVPYLKRLLAELGLSKQGNKADLVQRLKEKMQADYQKNGETLASHSIQKESMLHLVLRLSGC